VYNDYTKKIKNLESRINQNTLFSLDMLTVRLQLAFIIILIALKSLLGGGSAVKKGLSDLAFPLQVYNKKNIEKMLLHKLI
jgi:hypothetical protein